MDFIFKASLGLLSELSVPQLCSLAKIVQYKRQSTDEGPGQIDVALSNMPPISEYSASAPVVAKRRFLKIKDPNFIFLVKL